MLIGIFTMTFKNHTITHTKMCSDKMVGINTGYT